MDVAFTQPLLKHILMYGSIAIYIFIVAVFLLKKFYTQPVDPGPVTKSSKGSSVDGNDMFELFNIDNENAIQKQNVSDTKPEGPEEEDNIEDEEEEEYSKVFDDSLEKAKMENSEESNHSISASDINLDDDEESDEELLKLLNSSLDNDKND